MTLSRVSRDRRANFPTNVTSLLHSQSSTLQVALGVEPIAVPAEAAGGGGVARPLGEGNGDAAKIVEGSRKNKVRVRSRMGSIFFISLHISSYPNPGIFTTSRAII